MLIRLIRISDGRIGSLSILALVVAVASLLSACATDVYEGEVASFAKSVDGLNTSFSELVTKEGKVFFDREFTEMKKSTFSLRLGDGKSRCNELETIIDSGSDEELARKMKACTLHYQTTLGISEFNTSVNVENGRKLIQALSSYAKNLAEVSSAKDIDKLDTASAKLRNSVGSLIDTVNTVAKPVAATAPALAAITQSINLGGKFVLWVFREYQRYIRFQRFKAAVIAADPAIQLAQAPLGDQLSVLNRQLVLNQMAILNTSLLNPPQSKGDLANAYKEFALLQGLASFEGQATASNMVKAHAVLKQAVGDPKTQKKAVIDAFKAFKDQVEQLSDNLKKLNEESD